MTKVCRYLLECPVPEQRKPQYLKALKHEKLRNAENDLIYAQLEARKFSFDTYLTPWLVYRESGSFTRGPVSETSSQFPMNARRYSFAMRQSPYQPLHTRSTQESNETLKAMWPDAAPQFRIRCEDWSSAFCEFPKDLPQTSEITYQGKTYLFLGGLRSTKADVTWCIHVHNGVTPTSMHKVNLIWENAASSQAPSTETQDRKEDNAEVLVSDEAHSSSREATMILLDIPGATSSHIAGFGVVQVQPDLLLFDGWIISGPPSCVQGRSGLRPLVGRESGDTVKPMSKTIWKISNHHMETLW